MIWTQPVSSQKTDILIIRWFISYSFDFDVFCYLWGYNDFWMGIWDFSVCEYVLLFTALLVAREEIPFDFPRKIKNPETSEDFPKA